MLPDWSLLTWILVAVGTVVIGVVIARLCRPAGLVDVSSRRKMAFSFWGPPHEGYLHAKIEVDIEEAMDFIDLSRKETSERITMIHLVTKAIGAALTRVPELNRTLVGNRLIGHTGADVACMVGLGGDEISWVKLKSVELKSVPDIAQEVNAHAASMRAGDLKGSRRRGRLNSWIPVTLLRPLMTFFGWLTAGLGCDLKALGLDRFPVGRVTITNAAAYGLDEVWMSRTAFSHVPFNVVICRTRTRPVVVNGEIEARRCCNICINADHRYIDGLHLGRAVTIMKDIIRDPWCIKGHRCLEHKVETEDV